MSKYCLFNALCTINTYIVFLIHLRYSYLERINYKNYSYSYKFFYINWNYIDDEIIVTTPTLSWPQSLVLSHNL